jgi:hypothetical protein
MEEVWPAGFYHDSREERMESMWIEKAEEVFLVWGEIGIWILEKRI